MPSSSYVHERERERERETEGGWGSKIGWLNDLRHHSQERLHRQKLHFLQEHSERAFGMQHSQLVGEVGPPADTNTLLLKQLHGLNTWQLQCSFDARKE